MSFFFSFAPFYIRETARIQGEKRVAIARQLHCHIHRAMPEQSSTAKLDITQLLFLGGRTDCKFLDSGEQQRGGLRLSHTEYSRREIRNSSKTEAVVVVVVFLPEVFCKPSQWLRKIETMQNTRKKKRGGFKVCSSNLKRDGR